jgi:hypothetical protein
MKIQEFFQSDAGPLSMSRLLMFGSFIVSSVIMLVLTRADMMNEGYFSMYITAWSGSYLIGKGIDMKAATSQQGGKQ